MIDVRQLDGAILFTVYLQPRASRDEVAGLRETALRIRLAAPPVDDRANEALRRFLAARLKVPQAAVKIVSGQRSRTKRVEVRGATAAQFRAMAAPAARPPAGREKSEH
jgi:uncharacterized protein (TIGR00251 family)